MKPKPTISVIMSVYNGGDFLKNAISSILGQSFTNFEFIIVNDGSSDNTERIIGKYQNIDSRIVSISQSNKGLPRALNAAIKKAKGDYIARQDADDISHKDRLSKQLDYILREKADFSFCRAAIYRDTSCSGFQLLKKKKFIPPIRYINPFYVDVLRYRNVFVHGTFFGKTGLLKKNPYNIQYKYSQDYELWLRLFKLPVKYCFLKEVLYYYNDSAGNASNKNSKEQVSFARQACEKHFSSSKNFILNKSAIVRLILWLKLNLIIFFRGIIKSA